MITLLGKFICTGC